MCLCLFPANVQRTICADASCRLASSLQKVLLCSLSSLYVGRFINSHHRWVRLSLRCCTPRLGACTLRYSLSKADKTTGMNNAWEFLSFIFKKTTKNHLKFGLKFLCKSLIPQSLVTVNEKKVCLLQDQKNIVLKTKTAFLQFVKNELVTKQIMLSSRSVWSASKLKLDLCFCDGAKPDHLKCNHTSAGRRPQQSSKALLACLN